MSNKENLIEFILKLSDAEAETALCLLKRGKGALEELSKPRSPKYHRIIYSIKHNVTGREYIGITKNFEERIKAHLSCLRNGHHHVEDMQSDYDEFGEDYTISILEEITEYEKNKREYELMKEHKSYIRGKGYNYKDTVFKRREETARWNERINTKTR